MMKVKVKSYLPTKSYFMPNIVLTHGSPLSEGSDILINPLLLIEILSPSTKSFDRIIKFESYKKIPTFEEYLLISQDKRCVEQFYKDENGQWQFGEVLSKGMLQLKSMDAELNIDDLYFNVDVPEIVEDRD